MKTISDVKLSYLVKKLLGKIKDSNDEITTKMSSVEQQSKDNKDDIANLQADVTTMNVEDVIWEDLTMFTKECEQDYVVGYVTLPSYSKDGVSVVRKVSDYERFTIWYIENILVTRGPFVGECHFYPDRFTKGGTLFTGMGGSAFAHKPAIWPFETKAGTWNSSIELFREFRVECNSLDDTSISLFVSDCKNSGGTKYNYALIPYKIVGYRKVTATE